MLANLIKKIQLGSNLTKKEVERINTPIYKLMGFDTPEDHVRAVKHKNHSFKTNRTIKV